MHSTTRSTVDVAILTDGMVDVTQINGVRDHAGRDYADDRRLRPVAALPRQPDRQRRRADADAGQRQRPRQLPRRGLRAPASSIRISIDGVGYDARDRRRRRLGHRPDASPRRRRCPSAVRVDHPPDVDRSATSPARAVWTGAGHRRAIGGSRSDSGSAAGSSIRADARAGSADGFLEGQWVEVCVVERGRRLPARRAGSRSRSSAATTRRRTRSSSSARCDDARRRSIPSWTTWPRFGRVGDSHVIRRIAAVAHFDDTNWYLEQKIVLTPT